MIVSTKTDLFEKMFDVELCALFKPAHDHQKALEDLQLDPSQVQAPWLCSHYTGGEKRPIFGKD